MLIMFQKMGHLLAVTQSFLFQKIVPKTYWGEAILTSIHLINILPTSILDYNKNFPQL